MYFGVICTVTKAILARSYDYLKVVFEKNVFVNKSIRAEKATKWH